MYVTYTICYTYIVQYPLILYLWYMSYTNSDLIYYVNIEVLNIIFRLWQISSNVVYLSKDPRYFMKSEQMLWLIFEKWANASYDFRKVIKCFDRFTKSEQLLRMKVFRQICTKARKYTARSQVSIKTRLTAIIVLCTIPEIV